MSLDDLHDDEVRARLGLPRPPKPAPVDLREAFEQIGTAIEERLEDYVVRSMPEQFDPDTEAELEILDMRKDRR